MLVNQLYRNLLIVDLKKGGLDLADRSSKGVTILIE